MNTETTREVVYVVSQGAEDFKGRLYQVYDRDAAETLHFQFEEDCIKRGVDYFSFITEVTL